MNPRAFLGLVCVLVNVSAAFLVTGAPLLGGLAVTSGGFAWWLLRDD